MAERLSRREAYFVGAGVGIGVLGGFGVGYFVAVKRLDTKYNKLYAEDAERYEEELKSTRAAYSKARENWNKPELDEVVEKLGYSSAEQEAINEAEAESEEVVEEHNVFEEHADESTWDYDLEEAKRAELDPGVPYIIHRDEFFAKEDEFGDYDDTTITYYLGDDVLCDERDEVLEPRDHIVGGENLKMFGTGHGSGDPNVLYIRNTRTHCDFEVIANPAKYSEDALGFMQHSMFEPNRRKQHFDDE